MMAWDIYFFAKQNADLDVKTCDLPMQNHKVSRMRRGSLLLPEALDSPAPRTYIILNLS